MQNFEGGTSECEHPGPYNAMQHTSVIYEAIILSSPGLKYGKGSYRFGNMIFIVSNN